MRNWVLATLSLLTIGSALAADLPVTQDQAMALLQAGKRVEALHAFEAIIAAQPPDPTPALFVAALIDLEDGNGAAAKPYAQQLVKLRPSSFGAWELMIQADQAAGDQPDRDASIQALYAAWRSALDPETSSKIAFARDRIIGPKHTLVALETLDPGGDEILRFLFQAADQEAKPTHLIAVRSDGETNERWREDGTVPYGTVVYHLDTIEQLPNGQAAIRPYAFFLEPPDYDQVRTTVAGILNGSVQPLVGSPDPFWTTAPAR